MYSTIDIINKNMYILNINSGENIDLKTVDLKLNKNNTLIIPFLTKLNYEQDSYGCKQLKIETIWTSDTVCKVQLKESHHKTFSFPNIYPVHYSYDYWEKDTLDFELSINNIIGVDDFELTDININDIGHYSQVFDYASTEQWFWENTPYDLIPPKLIINNTEVGYFDIYKTSSVTSRILRSDSKFVKNNNSLPMNIHNKTTVTLKKGSVNYLVRVISKYHYYTEKQNFILYTSYNSGLSYAEDFTSNIELKITGNYSIFNTLSKFSVLIVQKGE